MLTSIWHHRWNIAALVAIWLAFECWISWAAFCDSGNNPADQYASKEYSCIFRGPIVSLTGFFYRWWNHVFDQPDAYVALFTAVLAFFTLALWRANQEQIGHNRRTERAYLWPGFASHLGRRHQGGGATWNISILNTGRTAGTLNEFYHALVSEEDYDAGRYHYIAVNDIGTVIPPNRPTEEMPSGVPVEVRTGYQISCGYIVYTDIYGDTHEQAWKHRLYSAGVSEPLPRCYSDPPDKNHH